MMWWKMVVGVDGGVISRTNNRASHNFNLSTCALWKKKKKRWGWSAKGIVGQKEDSQKMLSELYFYLNMFFFCLEISAGSVPIFCFVLLSDHPTLTEILFLLEKFRVLIKNASCPECTGVEIWRPFSRNGWTLHCSTHRAAWNHKITLRASSTFYWNRGEHAHVPRRTGPGNDKTVPYCTLRRIWISKWGFIYHCQPLCLVVQKRRG